MEPTVTLFYANVDALRAPNTFQRFYHTLPEHRRVRLDKLHSNKSKRLSMGAWMLLERALATAGIDATTAPFAFGPHGKPQLACGKPHFNLSHAGSMALCALCHDCEVGCDIEEVERCRNLKIAQACMQPTELAAIASPTDPKVQARTFCRLWTLKESYIKAIGRGLSCDPRSFRMELGRPFPQIFSDDKGFDTAVSFCELALDDAYACSVCARSQSFTVRTVPVDLSVPSRSLPGNRPDA